MPILENLEQVALMIALVLGILRTEPRALSHVNKCWYDAGSAYIPISPPTWLFSIVWPILYILEIIAMFRYVVHISPTPGTHLDTVVILFLIQVILCVWWYPLFFDLRRVKMAAMVILLILMSQLVCLSIMAVDDEWVSFALMLVLFLWCIFAGILNFYWVWVVVKHKEELEKFDEYEEIEPMSTEPSGSSNNGRTRCIGVKRK